MENGFLVVLFFWLVDDDSVHNGELGAGDFNGVSYH